MTVNPLTGLADSMGFERVTSRLDGPVYLDNGTEVSILAGAQAEQYGVEEEGFHQRLLEASLWQRSLKECRNTAAGGNAPKSPAREALCQQLDKVANDKVANHLPKDSAFRFSFEGNAGPLESAVETSRSSTVDASEFEAGDDDLLKEGMGTFIEAFGQGEPVCLNSPVTKITYQNDGVVLEVKNGKRYQARSALVTVSTGVLQAKRYEQQCASAMGDKPLSLERQACDEEAVQHAKAALSRMYRSGVIAGAEPPAPLDIAQAVDKASIYVTRWSLDPWTLGAYSAALPGAWSMREELGKAICSYDPSRQQEPAEEGCIKRLYFGGEATARPMFNGSFAGAHEAGLRNARQLLEGLEEEEHGEGAQPQ